MQAVRGGEVAGPELPTANRRAVLGNGPDVVAHQANSGGRCRLQQRRVQGGATHAHSDAGPEPGIDPMGLVEVGDAVKRPAAQRDTELLQLGHGVRHQALAAGLVDRPLPAVGDDDVESGPGGMQAGDQPGRSATHDEEIDHVRLASARFSVPIRVRSSIAFATVNTSAVSHAVCTSGSATPSAITAR